jgi:hypothetical protein
VSSSARTVVITHCVPGQAAVQKSRFDRSPAPGGRGRTRYRPSRERSWGSASCHRAGPVRRPGRPRATSSSAVASDLTTFSVTSGLSATCCCTRSRAVPAGAARPRAPHARPPWRYGQPPWPYPPHARFGRLRSGPSRRFAPAALALPLAETSRPPGRALSQVLSSWFCGSIGPGYCRWRAHSRRGRHRTSATTQACHPLRPPRRRSIVRPYSLRRRRPGRNECRSDRAGRPAEVLPMFATLSAAFRAAEGRHCIEPGRSLGRPLPPDTVNNGFSGIA